MTARCLRTSHTVRAVRLGRKDRWLVRCVVGELVRGVIVVVV